MEYFGFINHNRKFRLTLNDFEFNALKAAVNNECVALLDRSEIVLEIIFDLAIEEVACYALY